MYFSHFTFFYWGGGVQTFCHCIAELSTFDYFQYIKINIFVFYQVQMTSEPEVKVTEAECTCTIGKKVACGHVAALLYT